jgi:phage terminase large subunit-like protein
LDSVIRLDFLEELYRFHQERTRRTKLNRIAGFYPDSGPLRRELYPRHREFFQAGAIHRERCFLAANRVGKTEGVGAYELALHLTGRYPQWWNGRRFDHAIDAWAVGDTSKTVHREILQPKLLGKPGRLGTGMIPGDAILRPIAKPNVPEGIETVYVRHSSGGESVLTLKSYEQGRESFQGSEKHVIWLDEECPRHIYIECLLRTMTTNGVLILTFTPLLGLTELIKDFLGEGYSPKDTL